MRRCIVDAVANDMGGDCDDNRGVGSDTCRSIFECVDGMVMEADADNRCEYGLVLATSKSMSSGGGDI